MVFSPLDTSHWLLKKALMRETWRVAFLTCHAFPCSLETLIVKYLHNWTFRLKPTSPLIVQNESLHNWTFRLRSISPLFVQSLNPVLPLIVKPFSQSTMGPLSPPLLFSTSTSIMWLSGGSLHYPSLFSICPSTMGPSGWSLHYPSLFSTSPFHNGTFRLKLS